MNMQADILLASDDSKKSKKAFFAVTSKLEKQQHLKKVLFNIFTVIFLIEYKKQSKKSASRNPHQEIGSKKAKNRNYNKN